MAASDKQILEYCAFIAGLLQGMSARLTTIETRLATIERSHQPDQIGPDPTATIFDPLVEAGMISKPQATAGGRVFVANLKAHPGNPKPKEPTT